jgi:hypothetical protein
MQVRNVALAEFINKRFVKLSSVSLVQITVGRT